MLEVLNVKSCELDLIDEDGLHHFLVTADIADVRLVRPARLYPADIAEPAQYSNGQCSAVMVLDLNDEVPPNDSWSLHQYIQDKNLDWELDDNSDEF